MKTTEFYTEQFEDWIRLLSPKDGAIRRFGNVEFWIDVDGPWKGVVSFDKPTSAWDTKAIAADVTRYLVELGVPEGFTTKVRG